MLRLHKNTFMKSRLNDGRSPCDIKGSSYCYCVIGAFMNATDYVPISGNGSRIINFTRKYFDFSYGANPYDEKCNRGYTKIFLEKQANHKNLPIFKVLKRFEHKLLYNTDRLSMVGRLSLREKF